MSLAPGFASQIGFDTANPVTKRYQFLSTTLGMKEELIDANGIIGSRSQGDVERVRGGLQHINGNLTLEPTAKEWADILPWVLCGTNSGSGNVTYILGETAAERYITIDKVSKVFTYDGCAINRMTISGNQGDALRVSLDVLGKTSTKANAGTFPALSFDRTSAPFVFTDSDAGITINGVTVTPKTWTMTLDNFLDAGRFFNKITLAGQLALSRRVTLSLQVPYDTVHEALYGAGATGVTAALNSTNGSQKLNLIFPALTFPREEPGVQGRTEEMYTITGTAMRVGGASEFSCLSNIGP